MAKPILESDLNVGLKPEVNSGYMKRFTLRVGKIVAIHLDTHTVDINWLFPNRGAMSNIELNNPYIGLRSGINFVPEIGSVVTVGFAEDLPILLSYILPSNFDNMLLGVSDNTNTPMYMRKLAPGEISLNSSAQAEIYLSENIQITDIGNDSIIIRPKDGSINMDSLQLYIQNEAGTLTMGMVKRNNQIITSDGKAVADLDGGHALTEYKLKVNALADNTINDGGSNTTLAEITVGTLVDDSGTIVKDQMGKKIVCEINFASGAKMTVNEIGQFNFNEGNMAKPTDTSANPPSSSTQQRAAREGDRITIPITPGQTDTDHPQLNQKATANLTNLAQFAPMFYVMGIPAMFIPGAPNTKIIGEITQGSNDMFIGSLDKSKESTETSKNV